MIAKKILNLLQKESAFIDSYYHGISHWKRVERNGYYLAQFNNADVEVLSYFAYFHDCMRENENRDKGHGPRAAAFAKKHRELIPLNDIQFKQLTDACKGHTHGERPDCITINTCWDADRLDLPRVNITPNANKLHNEEAKRIANEFDYRVLESFKIKELPHVVFDLDNTIICEQGESVRPGMFELLNSLKSNGVKISLWTASTKARAKPIISKLKLDDYFSDSVYRDDYDPDATWGKSLPKDIRYLDGDMLIDDSKRNIEFVKSIGLKGFRIAPYISYIDTDLDEIERLHRFILPSVKFKIKRTSAVLLFIKKLFAKKRPVPKWIEC